jgi:acylphosphatase
MGRELAPPDASTWRRRAAWFWSAHDLNAGPAPLDLDARGEALLGDLEAAFCVGAWSAVILIAWALVEGVERAASRRAGGDARHRLAAQPAQPLGPWRHARPRRRICAGPLQRAQCASASRLLFTAPGDEPRRVVHVFVSGRVQGVGYRDWTVVSATAEGISGWVRNRRDGRVEAMFAGPPDAVARTLDACRRGPPAARVDAIAIDELSQDQPDEAISGFRRLATV